MQERGAGLDLTYQAVPVVIESRLAADARCRAEALGATVKGQLPEELAVSTRRGKWSQAGVPHKGWRCVDTEDPGFRGRERAGLCPTSWLAAEAQSRAQPRDLRGWGVRSRTLGHAGVCGTTWRAGSSASLQGRVRQRDVAAATTQ